MEPVFNQAHKNSLTHCIVLQSKHHAIYNSSISEQILVGDWFSFNPAYFIRNKQEKCYVMLKDS